MARTKATKRPLEMTIPERPKITKEADKEVANEAAKDEAKNEAQKEKPRKLAEQWHAYFSSSELHMWQMLMADLGFQETFTSKTQCRKVLKGVWVNIVDFLRCVQNGQQVRHFESEKALRTYTNKTRKFFPKREAKQRGSPLRGLLAHVKY